MPKTYKNVGGTWKPIKKVFTKIAGAWVEAKKVYKKVAGSWAVVHTSAIEYTFTSSITASTSTGILLSSYVNPASGDVFNITINAGVTLSGVNGATGADGAVGSYDTVSNCHSTNPGNGSNGAGGAAGGYCLNLTGFGGKTVNIINNGIIKGGNGGAGGNGGSATAVSVDVCLGNSHDDNSYSGTAYAGCGAGGGTGGMWLNNPAPTSTVNISGISPINGSDGPSGGYNGYYTRSFSAHDICVYDPCSAWGDGCCGCNAE